MYFYLNFTRENDNFNAKIIKKGNFFRNLYFLFILLIMINDNLFYLIYFILNYRINKYSNK